MDEAAIESEVVKLLRHELAEARERIRVLEATTVGPLRELRYDERRAGRAAAFSYALDLRSPMWPTLVREARAGAAKRLIDLFLRAELPRASSWADFDNDGRELIRHHRDVVGDLKAIDSAPRPHAVQRKIDFTIVVVG